MDSTQAAYGYGFTAESAKVVRQALAEALAWHIKQYGLKISVRKASSGYGGPRVDITTSNLAFCSYYEYIVDENGNAADCGKLVRVPTYKNSRPHYTARLIRAVDNSAGAKATDNAIRETLGQFGHDKDDAMTDYFDNTSPLFYGVEFEAPKPKFYINGDQVSEETFDRDNNDNFNAGIQSEITTNDNGDTFMTYSQED